MESNGADSLSVIAQARAALADRLVIPWWYHTALGLLLAGCVLVIGLGHTAVRIGGIVLLLVGCAALTEVYRRLTGVWVSGGHAGPPGRWVGAMGVVTLSAIVAAFGIVAWTGQRWPVWCLAGAVFAAIVVMGRRFAAALRAHLKAGA
ncbi:hypothetical protein C1I98_25455 [Spongiactinospora gelatinilytica]|uniref:Transmembrane protein n=1 Tax=Spongiactinospora gelatinilytica TaxID=2666298 RepID=A0A2W2GJB6_9ACTN|nr:hypothetical protein [Spongiactinospora gelatinilytica]PZG37440.1 hypothetical protein C1I98_25455 [Spongiactinospora gelatinilytica]